MKFSVRPSGIHGRGLFAAEFIPAETVLGQLKGTPTAEDGPYVLWLDETQGFQVENDLRYINHADEPNAAYYDDLTVVAIEDIHPGQEITHDYGGDDEDPAEFEGLDEQVELSLGPVPASEAWAQSPSGQAASAATAS